jgi:hypothetical protein
MKNAAMEGGAFGEKSLTASGKKGRAFGGELEPEALIFFLCFQIESLLFIFTPFLYSTLL